MKTDTISLYLGFVLIGSFGYTDDPTTPAEHFLLYRKLFKLIYIMLTI